MMKEKDDEIDNLKALCKKYNVERIRSKVLGKIQDRVTQMTSSEDSNMGLLAQAFDYLKASMEDHEKQLEAPSEGVVEMALRLYHGHLASVLQVDISALEGKKDRLAQMLKNLQHDKEQELEYQRQLLEEREEIEMGPGDADDGSDQEDDGHKGRPTSQKGFWKANIERMNEDIKELQHEYLVYQLWNGELGANISNVDT